MSAETQRQLVSLLRQHLVLDMPALRQAFPQRSLRSLIDHLQAVGYLASCNASGRFYTLKELADFDADGLWRQGPALFSQHGTLKATLCHLVDVSDDGRTHEELRSLLRFRVHNTLLELCAQGKISREQLARLFVYLSADVAVRGTQLARRRARLAQWEPPPLELDALVDVLLAIIRLRAEHPEDVMQELRACGRTVTLEQVRQVFDRYGLGKKHHSA